MELIFNTGNKLKFEIAQKILSEYDVEIVQKKVETPEIQAFEGKEVAEYSAKTASKLLGSLVVKTDVSYHISSLNGFPGPYIKYINKWLSANDVLRLMQGKKDRGVVIKEFLSIADGDKIKTFKCESIGTIADKIYSDKGTTIDKLFIREGYNVPQNMLTKQQLDEVFRKDGGVWHKLGKYLQNGIGL